MAEQTETQRFTNAVNAGIRKAARHLLEQSRNLPAPCGCTPKVRCDRHCRVRITSRRDQDGDLTWVALCNGIREDGWCAGAHGDLDRVHDWATGHVTYHRKLLGAS